jgi:hypothetical protein
VGTFQTIFRFLTPSWLHTGEGELVLASLALIKDAFAERALQGLDARFPSRTGASALALTGQDRGIIRGRSETDAQYAARLIGWRYPRGHRTRGSAFALLSQVGAYWGDFVTWTIDRRGNYHERSASGAESYEYGVAWDWDSTPATPQWARFWVAIEPSSGSGVAAWLDFWGGELSPDVTVGQTGVTPDDVRAMVRLFEGRAWKPAGTRAEWLIVSLDGSDQTPDGTWGTWSQNVSGTQIATRYSNWRFWALSATVNLYAGDVDNFPDDTEMPGGGTYAGDHNVFPASTTLPDGSTYAGDHGTFPEIVRLVDDGSPPQ